MLPGGNGQFNKTIHQILSNRKQKVAEDKPHVGSYIPGVKASAHSKRFATCEPVLELAKPLECAASPRFGCVLRQENRDLFLHELQGRPGSP